MTDPITQVAEEMRLPRGGTGEPTFIDYLDKAWATRIRAYWTPQRRAFMETAEEYVPHMLGDFGDFESTDWSLEEAKMMKAYYAMIEAEKGEK